MPFREQPPRKLSLYSQAVLLFSGIYAIIGWIFFGFGMIFFWVFTYNSTAMLWFSGSKQWESHEGVIKKIINTNASEDEESIYEIRYVYEKSGTEYGGRSFVIGEDYEIGEKIGVEYNAKRIEQSRMIGGRSKMFSWWTIFIVIFPLIALLLIVKSLKTNIKSLFLIKNGVFTTGTMKSRTPTNSNIEINGIEYPIYKYEFDFKRGASTYIAHCKTHKTQLVEDEVEEFILFLPNQPNYNTVYDAIPNVPAINQRGQLIDIPIEKIYCLIAPTFAILLNSFLVYYMVFL